MFADDNINKCGRRIEMCFWRVENIVGKGENAGYHYFLLIPQCFQKATYIEVLIDVILLYRVKLSSAIAFILDKSKMCCLRINFE